MDFVVYTTMGSEGRIAEWADLGVVPEVEVHDVEGLKVGSLEDAMHAPTPKVVVIDVDWQVAPPYIAEEVERLVDLPYIVVFLRLRRVAMATQHLVLQELLPHSERASRFCARLRIPVQKVPGFAEAICAV